MFDVMVLMAKASLTVATIIIAGLGLWQKWIFNTDRLYEKYSKLSNFSFELAKKTNDPTLEQIAKEYGYAAITRENKLSHEERRTLLKMVNPVNGIEGYHKCSDYIKINIIDNCFTWRYKRHNSQAYRLFLDVIFTTIYLIGCTMFFSPIFYIAFIDTSIGAALHQLPPIKKVGTFAFLIMYGAFFLLPSLNKISKLNRSLVLIKTSNLQTRRYR